MLRIDRRAKVMHANPANPGLVAPQQAYRRTGLGMAHGIGQQVAQCPLQQLLIGHQRPAELIVQVQLTILGQRLEVITQPVTHLSKVQHLQLQRALAVFGAGEKHQVFCHAIEPFIFFDIRRQHLLVLGRAA